MSLSKLASPLSARSDVPEAVAQGVRVVVVDDDELFLESLGQNLVDCGFDVTRFDNAPAALAYFRGGATSDIILLDWKMPEMNGIELLQALRDEGILTPVVFLTALSDQIYEEAALRKGAVDFVEKSRSFSILVQRINLIVEGVKAAAAAAGVTLPPTDTDGDSLRLGELELKLDTQRAFWKTLQVPLSLTEFRMVEYLARRHGKDVRYREIYDLVHGKDFVAGAGGDGYRANVRTFIKRIRQKFRDLDDGFDRIENYAGFGYRWRDGDGDGDA